MRETTSKRIFDRLVLALIILNIILIGVSIAILIGSAQQKLLRNADFTGFYTAFFMVRHGVKGELYDLNLQTHYQQEIIKGSNGREGMINYFNPPFVALFFSPLSVLNLDSAYIVWTVGQLFLLSWLIYLLNILTSEWDRRERRLLFLTVLAYWPLGFTILLGQFSIFILICLIQMYISLKNANLHRAGIWFALLIVKPQTFLIPVVIVLNKRYLRVALMIIIVCVGIVFSSSIFLGWEPWMQYGKFLPSLTEYFGSYGFYPNTEYTFRGVLSMIFGYVNRTLINTLSNFMLLLSMVISWFLWLRNISPEIPKFKLHFAFVITLSVFFSMHSYSYDCLVLILPVILFYDYLRVNGYPRRVFSLFILGSPIFFTLDVFIKYTFINVVRPPVIIIVIFLAWMIYYLILEQRKMTVVQPKQLSQIKIG